MVRCAITAAAMGLQLEQPRTDWVRESSAKGNGSPGWSQAGWRSKGQQEGPESDF